MSSPSVNLLYIYTSSSTALANISASAACLTALTADVPCYANLGSAVTDTTTWSPSALGYICTKNCTTALSTYVTNVDSACGTEATYNISGTIQTAADLGREMQWRQSTTCLTDPTSGEYCNTYFQGALNSSSTSIGCSTCYLTYLESIVNSEWGQALISDSAFESRVSSCSATGYSATYTATSSSSTSTATATVTSGDRCNKTDASVVLYTVLANDSCIDISASQNVSTGALTSLNGLDLGCSYLSKGETLCLPTTCDVYLVKTNDTCASIINNLSSEIVTAELASWNANINSQCSNLATLVGTYICISPPGSALPLYLAPATTAVSVPTNAVGTSNVDCGHWYTIVVNDTCESVEAAFGISNTTFYFLNPQIEADCRNLWLGNSYCVEQVGDIATYSGYSTVAASIANYTSLPSTINMNATATANRTTTHFFYSWPTPTTTTLASVNASVYSVLATYTLCLDVEIEYNITETGPTQDMYDDAEWISEYDRVCVADPNDLPTVPFNSSIVYTAPASANATTTSGSATSTSSSVLATATVVASTDGTCGGSTGFTSGHVLRPQPRRLLQLQQLQAQRVRPHSSSLRTARAVDPQDTLVLGQALDLVVVSTGIVALQQTIVRRIAILRESLELARQTRSPQMVLAEGRQDTPVPGQPLDLAVVFMEIVDLQQTIV
ncbi:uncharacterized protein PAC_05559 [Phialocephala subalpina]|uniref:LysM domain-containing protein n=1 Tax=Phialocephala subalpina TaxID=576137 RepID=A0A1L7WSB9_9HELO|nr:uncharacterized protein PAC_05559 [Phialocephala subalpina]